MGATKFRVCSRPSRLHSSAHPDGIASARGFLFGADFHHLAIGNKNKTQTVEGRENIMAKKKAAKKAAKKKAPAKKKAKAKAKK